MRFLLLLGLTLALAPQAACRLPPDALAQDGRPPELALDAGSERGPDALLLPDAATDAAISTALRAQLYADVHAYLSAETETSTLLGKLAGEYAKIPFSLLAEAVRARPAKPTLPGTGVHEGSWLSPYDGKQRVYSAYVPTDVASRAAGGQSDRFPLIVYLHGAGGTGPGITGNAGIRAAVDALGAILVAPTDPDTTCDWSAAEECMAQVVLLTQLLKRRYPIDDQQVVLTGFSMGGRGSFSVGVAYPEPYCGVIPFAGTIGAVFNDPNLQVHKNYCCPHLKNAASLRLRYFAGDQDTALLLYQNQGCALCFAESSAEHEYVELAGQGHVFLVDRWQTSVAWALSKPRQDFPPLFVFNLVPQASGIVAGGVYLHEKLKVPQYWAVPRGRSDAKKSGAVSASVLGQTVTVTTSNLSGVDVYLSDALVDLDLPVKVVIDGETVHDGLLTRDRRLLLEQARLRSERSMLFAAKVGSD